MARDKNILAKATEMGGTQDVTPSIYYRQDRSQSVHSLVGASYFLSSLDRVMS